jgi:transcriptional regulator with XRE-family HTH domain
MARRSRTEKKWCKRLKEVQETSGISQQKMAEEMSKRMKSRWRQSRIWKLLCCDMPVSLVMFEEAASILGISIEDLATRNRDGKSIRLDDPREIKLIARLRSTNALDHVIEMVNLLFEYNDRHDKRRNNRGRPKTKRENVRTSRTPESEESGLQQVS